MTLPKCSVLLVEDSADSVLLVNHFLSGSRMAEFRVTTAGTLLGAREALGRERFDVVLLDLNLPDSHGLGTFAAVREVAGCAAIVILTAVEDESVATAALGQGATDYLIKGELGGEALARRIRFAVERQRAAPAPEAPRAARVTTILGAKGGAGASTVALNVAAALARRERDVILLELRRGGGSLAAILNVSTPLTIETLAEMGGQRQLQPGSGKLPFGPRLLAAPMSPEAGGNWDSAAAQILIDRCVTSAAHVVIDTTALHPELAQVATARSSFTVLVIERESVSLQMAAHITRALSAWAGGPARIGAALVNQPHIDGLPLPDIRAQINCGIVAVLPPARDLIHSYRRKGPVVLAQPHAPISMALDELAARLEQDPVPLIS